ncbi:MAG: glutathione S-transferase family protein [Pseudorhodoplanes sp.]|nr:Glutathionyl-hydroquinone reductase YqjG [Pseudorhodoplanes sp.]MBW7949140.1 glutathione S-transferase family protein [Pseudorhodoplanes sp.]GIK80146.1 MAG: glutathione-dependent reductase [Alphaproteobacteria bacterium]
MGLFIDGVWHDQWYDTGKSRGRFEREATRFRHFVTPDGAPGPSGDGGFAAERGRYHLYVSLACPWAHRTLIFRALKKLDDAISVSVVSPLMGAQGWTFAQDEGSSGDAVNGARTLGDIYLRANPKYSGRVTVPVLWDKKRATIVNNESAEIVRMLNSAFDAFTPVRDDYYPPALRAQIDALNDDVYPNINNGVYRAGFATTQEAYEEAYRTLFAALARMEERLSRSRYLAGAALTEADWRLFTTLVRFDAVYYGHFKCNERRIADYSNLSNYVRELFQMPGVGATVDLDHIKRHYYWSHAQINPTRIVPLGPALDFTAPHDRARL